FYIVRFSIVEKEDFKVIVFFCYASLIYNFFKINLDQNSYSNRYHIEDININFTSYSLVAILYIYILIYKYNFVNSRIIFLFFNLFTFLLVFLLQTRGALISIVLMWIWLVFKKNNFTKLKSIYIYMLLIVGLAITLGLFNFLLSIMDFYFFSERGTGDLSGRTQLWSLAYTIIKDNPIVGVGIGSFESISLTGVAVHNFYLNIILEMGLVGLLIYFFCFAFLFINKIKFNINEKLIFTFGLFLSFILPISISGSWQLAPILWVLFGVTFNILRVNKNA
ncbi:O-antigen ligase family protein, partial [Acinetobacter indicus]|uniref:O-antigen ligase family protein n=1 Tax=Acinetobacter indicus TaxID=756892 RepID=UPI0034D606AF